MKRKRQPASARRSTRAIGTSAERRAVWHYRLRGYRVLARNVWIGGYELDVVVRRGKTIVFCEVKAKRGAETGDPLEMITREKIRRLRQAAEVWLASSPESLGCEARFDVAAEREGKLSVVADAF